MHFHSTLSVSLGLLAQLAATLAPSNASAVGNPSISATSASTAPNPSAENKVGEPNQSELLVGGPCQTSWDSYMGTRAQWQYDIASSHGQLTAHKTTDIYETIETIGPSISSNDLYGIPRVSLYTAPNATQVRTRNVTVIKTRLTPNSAFLSSVLPNKLKYNHPVEPVCQLSDDACIWFWAVWNRLRMHAREILSDELPIDEGIPAPCMTRNLWGSNMPPENPNDMTRICEMVTGGEVLLLFFPPKPNVSNVSSVEAGKGPQLGKRDSPGIAAEALHGDSGLFSTTALTFRGQDLYHRTQIVDGVTRSLPRTFVSSSVLHGNWTFTSPFVYVAHHPLTGKIVDTPLSQASGDYSAFISMKSFRSAGVLTLLSTDIQTGIHNEAERTTLSPADFATKVQQGKFQIYHPDTRIGVVQVVARDIQVEDFIEPIAADKYYDARRDDCWGEQSHCATITAGSFRPKLYFFGPDWRNTMSDCWNPGLVDPPIALQPLSKSSGLDPPLTPYSQPTPPALGGDTDSRPASAAPTMSIYTPRPTPNQTPKPTHKPIPYHLGPDNIATVPKYPKGPGKHDDGEGYFGRDPLQIPLNLAGETINNIDHSSPEWKGINYPNINWRRPGRYVSAEGTRDDPKTGGSGYQEDSGEVNQGSDRDDHPQDNNGQIKGDFPEYSKNGGAAQITPNILHMLLAATLPVISQLPKIHALV